MGVGLLLLRRLDGLRYFGVWSGGWPSLSVIGKSRGSVFYTSVGKSRL